MIDVEFVEPIPTISFTPVNVCCCPKAETWTVSPVAALPLTWVIVNDSSAALSARFR